MRLLKYIFLSTFLIVFVFTLPPSHARKKSIIGKAEVTLLNGSASLQKKGTANVRTLFEGDLINPGDRITTSKKSKIEIRLPDDSILRFDEMTTFKLESAFYNKMQKERKIHTILISGKVWANVYGLSNGKGYFAISTKYAVAGVKGTVFRIDVDRNFASVIKVYHGEVEVMNRPIKTDPPPKDSQQDSKQKNWSYSVKSMHQLIIHQDETHSRPFRFALKPDVTNWVLWNQNRDKNIKKE